MSIPADRVTGAFFFLFGLAMYFLIIPSQVELGDDGNLAPDTLPNALSIVIAACGLLLALRPGNDQTHDLRFFLMTGKYVALLAAGIYAMSHFGFVLVAPPMAFVLMWMIGERRPLWFAGGVVVMPALIWVLVSLVLERALP